MPHHTPLITMIVAGLVLAFLIGALAQRVKIPPLVGYLLAGVIIGPFTPGYVADQGMANELAEIGVILLMFGVGLHFSLKDLLSVRAIAIPGALVQITAATVMGLALAWAVGWTISAGIVFGLALSVASTVVLLRALQERHLIDTDRGRIAVGWLIVEDIVTVLALVLLPAMAEMVNEASSGGFDATKLLTALALTVGKVAGFVVVMLVVGRRVIPWILHHIAHMGSRELFRLAVLAIALGVAFGAAELFGVSFALGAFFAGMILNESPLSQRAAQETLPLRDAFAVLFFVSVGMLFNPSIVTKAPFLLLATLLIILIGKSIAAFLIVRLFGYPRGTALTISASLAQIGEFSFILAGLGVALKLLPEQAHDLILAGSIISILLNPLAFLLLDRLKPRIAGGEDAKGAEDSKPEITPTALTDHFILIGFGRVGSLVGEGLISDGASLLVIEERLELADALRKRGVEVIVGNAAAAAILQAANLTQARGLFIAIPNEFEAGQIVGQARKLAPSLEIVARAHMDAEVAHLEKLGANFVIMGEREIAMGMLDYAKARNQKPAIPAGAA